MGSPIASKFSQSAVFKGLPACPKTPPSQIASGKTFINPKTPDTPIEKIILVGPSSQILTKQNSSKKVSFYIGDEDQGTTTNTTQEGLFRYLGMAKSPTRLYGKDPVPFSAKDVERLKESYKRADSNSSLSQQNDPLGLKEIYKKAEEAPIPSSSTTPLKMKSASNFSVASPPPKTPVKAQSVPSFSPISSVISSSLSLISSQRALSSGLLSRSSISSRNDQVSGSAVASPPPNSPRYILSNNLSSSGSSQGSLSTQSNLNFSPISSATSRSSNLNVSPQLGGTTGYIETPQAYRFSERRISRPSVRRRLIF